MQAGECKLCRQRKELCDSHYLPKSVYRSGRAEELKNPNPVVLANGQWKQAADQLRGYVFCYDCEQMLNEKGEKWTMANTPHEYEEVFPLQKALIALHPVVSQGRLDMFQVRGQAGFDLEKLIYFGLSVFWRGAVHHWKSTNGAHAPKLDLGEWEEPMRKFLLDSIALPANLVLTLDVWPYNSRHQMSSPPGEMHRSDCLRYWFVVPGLLYRLYLGDNIPEGLRARNLLEGFVGVDREAIDTVLDITRERLKENMKGPRIAAMFEEIRAIRSKGPSGEGKK
jgi:hypothetical protein